MTDYIVGSAPAAPQAESQVEQHITLHDVLCQKLVRNRPLYSRVCIIGRRVHMADSLKPMFRDVTNPTKIGGCTGTFSGIYAETPSNFIHFLEGEPKDLLKVLSELQHSPQRNGKAEDIQILSYTDDITDRSFSKWVTLDINNHGTALVQNEESLKDDIVQQLYHFMDLGALLFTKEKLQIENFLSAMKSSRPELLPSIAQVDSFLDSGMCFTLEEFLEIFNVPVDIKLQCEVVWPIPPPLKY
jgi:hypothetical protein